MNYSIENPDGNFRNCDYYSLEKFSRICFDCECQESCLDMRVFDLEKKEKIDYFENLFLRKK